jgi:sRNA-binding regulator protein Hfq
MDAETPAEQRLLDQGLSGAVVSLEDLDEDDRVVRAEFIRDLVLHAEEGDSRGLRMRGARIHGSLDLMFVTCRWPLSFSHTTFDEEVVAERARIPGLELRDSALPGFRGRGALIDHDLSFNGSTVSGPTSLQEASIKGQLQCAGARLENPEGDALSLDGAEIAAVFLNNGFHATGEVRALGAQIKGSLECAGARLENPEGDALSLDRAEIAGVFLTEGFHATGEVGALDTVIKGPLACAGATLENPEGDALSLDRAQIAGSVFLTEGFHATGAVRALGTVIKGSLACAGATLENPDGNSLVLDRAEIRGDVFFTALFQATGVVRAPGARFGGALVCSDAKLSNSGGLALTLQHATLTRLTLRRSAISGGIDLYRVQVVTLDDDLGRQDDELAAGEAPYPSS